MSRVLRKMYGRLMFLTHVLIKLSVNGEIMVLARPRGYVICFKPSMFAQGKFRLSVLCPSLINVGLQYTYIVGATTSENVYTFWYVRPPETQISLHIRSLIRIFVVRLEKLPILDYLKCAHWRFGSACAFAGHTCPKYVSCPCGPVVDSSTPVCLVWLISSKAIKFAKWKDQRFQCIL